MPETLLGLHDDSVDRYNQRESAYVYFGTSNGVGGSQLNIGVQKEAQKRLQP